MDSRYMRPQLTVSGYRGIWGDTLTFEIAERFAWAFSRYILKRDGSTIFIGRDARESGEELIRAVAEVLRESGLKVIIGGILPTPTILYLTRTGNFDGAMIITASHNPREYNGLKFVTTHGMFTNEHDVAEIKDYFNEDVRKKQDGGSIGINKTLGVKHIHHIIENVDSHFIRSKRFNVVLDPINSAGAILTPDMLRQLGCDVTVINGEPDGDFAHEPEPLPWNLTQLAEKVTDVGADIGFAQDPDADRLVVCDEYGRIVFEEYTLSLAILAVLEKKRGDIVINMSTSNTNEDIARIAGVKTFRTKVGEANVVGGIVKNHAVIGGEGGGGVIYPAINPCRDSLTGIALILELLAHEGKPLSEIVAALPHYIMSKQKFSYSGDVKPLYEKMKKAFPGATVNELDGLRLDFPDRSWIHLRPSNTEPIVRLIGEAKTKERIGDLVETVKNLI